MSSLISVKNDRVKRLRQLTTRRGRRKAGRYLILGRKIVQDAVRLPFSRAHKGLEIYKTAQSAAFDPKGHRLFEIDVPDFSKVLGSDFAYDVIAAAESPKVGAEFEKALKKAGEQAAICIPCGVQDPGNLGTILRSSWFLGINTILLTPGNADPWSPKVQRAASGAFLRLPLDRIDSAQAALEVCARHDFRPVLLQTRGGKEPQSILWPKRVAFFLGEEGQGFARQNWNLSKLDTLAVTIRAQHQQANSLNVAAAYAIVAHAWSRSRAS